MQLPSNLVAFWQRLTRTQRLSLVSLLFFLVVLPVAIWLSLSPTSPFSRAGGGPITGPTPSGGPTPPGFPQPPTCTLAKGPSKGTTYSFVASGQGTGRNLKLIELYQRSAATSGEKREHFTKIGAALCNSQTCTLSTSYTFPTPGDYVVVCNAYYTEKYSGSAEDACSGNTPGVFQPPYDSWSYCGQNSSVDLSIPKETVTEQTQTFKFDWGYNLVGVNFNTGKEYKAEDFLVELNKTFLSGFQATNAEQPAGGGPPPDEKNPVKNIFRYDAKTRTWQVHTLGKTRDDNFPIVTGESYFVRVLNYGTARRTAPGPTSIQLPITVEKGWSLISLPIVPIFVSNAEALLQAAKQVGIDVRSIARWDAANYRYQMHRINTTSDNFLIVAGEGYWIFNQGETKTFNFGSTPTPSPSPTGIILPPLPE